MTRKPILIALAGFGVLAALLTAQEKKPDPVRFDPVVKKMEGWTIHIDPAMLPGGEHAESGEKALKMLGNHLQRVVILVPEKSLAKLRTCEIWIEHHHPTLGNMQYHPGIAWLRNNGHDPRLNKKVHIPRAAALLSRGQMLKHPAVVLHELAHAYHDQLLSFDEPEIIAAYEKARDSGSYDKVMLFTGQDVKHYAMTNHKEYFAEGTEAFFYRNDFYPFVRAELKKHDPDLDAIMEKVWD
jgi:dipeptidyl-peptidase-4